MSTAFTQPQAFGNFLKPADLNGHLLLFTAVHEAFDRFDDLAGKDKLNVRFDYVDLDSPEKELIEGAISSHPGIALRLKGSVGKDQPVLGRIGQEPSKKAGFNPTWVLGEFTPGVDDAAANAWLTARATRTVTQPAAPAPVAQAPAAAPAPGLSAETRAQMIAQGIAIPPGM